MNSINWINIGLTNLTNWDNEVILPWFSQVKWKILEVNHEVIRGSENPNPVNRLGVHGYVNGDTDVFYHLCNII